MFQTVNREATLMIYSNEWSYAYSLTPPLAPGQRIFLIYYPPLREPELNFLLSFQYSRFHEN